MQAGHYFVRLGRYDGKGLDRLRTFLAWPPFMETSDGEYIGVHQMDEVRHLAARRLLLREHGVGNTSMVQSSRYVLACYRYIEMNPVRANMARLPGEYPWSSHAANAEGKQVKWLAPHGEYLALGLTAESRCAAYRGLFASELDPTLLRGIRGAVHAGYTIGSQRFRTEIESALKERVARQPIAHYAVMML